MIFKNSALESKLRNCLQLSKMYLLKLSSIKFFSYKLNKYQVSLGKKDVYSVLCVVRPYDFSVKKNHSIYGIFYCEIDVTK